MEKVNLKFKIKNLKFPGEFWILALILVTGAFFRLYKIDQYMTFLGDEGRDAIIVRRFIVSFDPMLIGPGTSIGNMYLGPLYYYLMAPALFLARLSPVGPAVQVALLGVATIWLVWFVAREWFGKSAALIASTIYAISPTVIVFSRSSWNPNIMPFFALLCIYAIWRVWQKHEFKWLIVFGFAYAFVLQSHYLGLLLAPVMSLFWLLTFWEIKNSKLTKNYKLKIRNFLLKSLLGFLIFAGLMSPLVIFDARHSWRNFIAMKTFFTVRQETVSARPWKALPKLWPIFTKINTRLLAGQNETVGRIVSVIFGIFIVWIILSWKKLKILESRSYVLLLIWLLVAMVGFGLYKQEIYDHYYGFFFAAPFLLLGAMCQYIVRSKKYKAITDIAFILLILLNLQNSPLKYPPNQQLRRAKEVAQKIAAEAGGEKFNLAVIAERNYEDGYQYFLEMWGEPVVEIDAQKPETITDQLFVVCEMPKEKCDPTHSPKAEVANFGWSKIENEWVVFGTQVFKLVHRR